MAQKDTNAVLATGRAGSLAFTLGCLPLVLVGLVVQLVSNSDAALPLQILMLIGWLATGGFAAIAFFLLSRPAEGESGAKLIGEFTFCLLGITIALTTCIVMLSPQFGDAQKAGPATSTSMIGSWSLGVLLGLGALTLPSSLPKLLVLWIPGIAISLTSCLFWDTSELSNRAVQLAIAIAPAIVIALFRMRNASIRHQRETLEGRVEAFGGELNRAREIHDSMFPDPIEGDIRLEYTYDPLLGIGGDFLHVHQHESSGRVTLTLLDVSGHGLAAALTVNRLFGELERICAEHPDEVTPQLLMCGLNRYVHLVMAKHSLYATAACVQMDPGTSKLHWVVSGHPPPLLRLRNGSVEDLDCTSVILGALEPELFEPNERTKSLGIGDVVLVYTDGTFESRNEAGEFFGLARLRETFAFDTPPRDWSRFVASTVERFRGKHSGQSQSVEDDLLVASMTLSAQRRIVEVTPKSQVDPNPPAQAVEHEEATEPSQVADQDRPQ